MMRSLIHRQGVETVRLGYQNAGRDATSEEIEAVFVDVFGDGIYDDYDAFVEEEQCSLQAWECSDAVVPMRQLPVAVERTTDCVSDPSFTGATAEGDENWFPEQRFIVELGEEATVRVDTTDNAHVRKMSCLSSCADLPFDASLSFSVDSFGTTVYEIPWSAGRHSIIVRPLDVARPFSARIDVVE